MNSGVAAAISRRKIRGLTRTGRQVSEDPDIDNLLSNLSPEEMEELQKEVLTVPDPDPDTNVLGGIRKRSPPEKQASLNNNVEPRGHETSKLSQRQVSVEGEPRKESLKQQYLRKMGLSQERSLSRSESQDGEVMTQSSVPGERDREGAGDRPGSPNRFRRAENREAERKEAGRRTEVNSDSKLRDKKEEAKRKEDGSKTKELISKLREKKEDTKEKERKDEVRKDSKTKELISKLQERGEKEESKEKERKEESSRRKEESKTRGLVSRLEEKQSQVKENKTDDRKSRSEDKGKMTVQHDDTGSQQEMDEEKTRRERERNREAVKEKEKGQSDCKGRDNEREKESVKANMKDLGEGLKPKKNKEPAAGKIQDGKTKEKEEEEDEDASMFDELLEKVSSNDSQLVELNVNNSEVIKTKTLIHFAEALRDNTHVKTFALANSRADDHVAYAIAGMLRANKTVTSINLDSNHLTSKGITSLIHALQHNATLTELRFHNQRHICGGKTEMEMAKVLKDNTTLLKLGYHFELAGPRMTMTNILSRNMDRQRQRRLQEQKQAQANGDKKGTLEVPKAVRGFKTSPKASPKASPLPSPQPSPQLSPKVSPKKGGGGAGPPPPPPPPPPAPALDVNCLRNSLTPVSQRKLGDNVSDRAGGKNSRDQLLASIRNSNIKQLKKVDVPKLLQ